jgi:hypothetical protein
MQKFGIRNTHAFVSESDDNDEQIGEAPSQVVSAAAPLTLGEVIANARKAIAEAAGVAVTAVKIKIDLD